MLGIDGGISETELSTGSRSEEARVVGQAGFQEKLEAVLGGGSSGESFDGEKEMRTERGESKTKPKVKDGEVMTEKESGEEVGTEVSAGEEPSAEGAEGKTKPELDMSGKQALVNSASLVVQDFLRQENSLSDKELVQEGEAKVLAKRGPDSARILSEIERLFGNPKNFIGKKDLGGNTGEEIEKASKVNSLLVDGEVQGLSADTKEAVDGIKVSGNVKGFSAGDKLSIGAAVEKSPQVKVGARGLDVSGNLSEEVSGEVSKAKGMIEKSRSAEAGSGVKKRVGVRGNISPEVAEGKLTQKSAKATKVSVQVTAAIGATESFKQAGETEGKGKKGAVGKGEKEVSAPLRVSAQKGRNKAVYSDIKSEIKKVTNHRGSASGSVESGAGADKQEVREVLLKKSNPKTGSNAAISLTDEAKGKTSRERTDMPMKEERSGLDALRVRSKVAGLDQTKNPRKKGKVGAEKPVLKAAEELERKQDTRLVESKVVGKSSAGVKVGADKSNFREVDSKGVSKDLGHGNGPEKQREDEFNILKEGGKVGTTAEEQMAVKGRRRIMPQEKGQQLKADATVVAEEKKASDNSDFKQGNSDAGGDGKSERSDANSRDFGVAKKDSTLSKASESFKSQLGRAQSGQSSSGSPAEMKPLFEGWSAKITMQNVQRLIKSGESRAFVRLNPQSLGMVEVDIKNRSGEISVTFRAENPAAIAELQNNIGDLRASLKEAGLKLGDYDFRQGFGEGHAGAADDGRAQDEGGGHGRRSGQSFEDNDDVNKAKRRKILSKKRNSRAVDVVA